MVVEDIEQSPIFVGMPALDIQRRAGVRAVQSRPLISHSGEFLGMLSTHYRQPCRIDEHTSVVLDLLAQQAAELILAEQARQSLQRLEKRYRSFLEMTNEWTWVTDPAGLIVDVEPGLQQYSGLSFEEIKNAGWVSILHPDDKARTEAAWKRCVATKEPYEIEYRLRRHDGEYRWMLGKGVPILDEQGEVVEWSGTCADITERKAVEQALRNSDARFNLAMEAAVEGIWDWNLDSGVVYYSPGYARMLGYEPSELAADVSSWVGLLHPDDEKAVVQEAADRLRDVGHYALEFRMRCRDGNYRWVLSRGKVVERSDEGQPRRAIGTHVDITELREARDSAVRLNNLKDAFLANMSHEVRTPMNGVLGMAGLLRRTQLTPKQADYLDTIEASGKHLMAIINDVLDLSKLEAGLVKLAEEDFRLADLVREAHSVVGPQINAKQLRFSINLDDVPQLLRGDRTRLLQALVNYLDNAVKFSTTGKVAFAAQLVEESKAGCLVRFEVTDTGIGMTTEQQAGIFQPFVQADGSMTRQYGGTGLGLVLAKRIARLMGGEAGVTSEYGKGSTFWLTARLQRGSELEAKSAAPLDAEAIIRRDWTGTRVLLVEDEWIDALVARSLLEEVGLVVDEASNGLEGLNAFQRERYGLVLMDLRMPVMDGFKAAQAIRLHAGGKQVPILAVTANVLSEDREACLAAGMNDFIRKPFMPDALFETLLKWLDKSRKAGA